MPYEPLSGEFYQYGGLSLKVKRQMLHAELLGFLHPDSLRYVEFAAPAPMDMACLLQWLNENQ
ncbi:hypothetical protein ES703_116791 [subsurface metagenome]